MFRSEVKTTGEGYRPDIDGLRGLAVALVVCFHAFPDLVPGGFIGVDVFFVISGYLITGIMLPRVYRRDFSFGEFYARRCRRILPALAVVMLSCLLLGWFTLRPSAYTNLAQEELAGAGFFSNLYFWKQVGYFDAAAQTKPLLHLWSLGVEEQFYLVWPAFLIGFGRNRRLTIVAICTVLGASLVYSIYAMFVAPAAAFYSPVSRLWELGVGALLAAVRLDVRYRDATALAGIALILGTAFLLNATSPLPGLRAVVSVLGTAMVIISRSRLLSASVFIGVGLISYPLYLWHWPLLFFGEDRGFAAFRDRLVIVGISVCLATLTYQAIERPVRFGQLRKFGVLGASISMIAIAALSGAVFASGGALSRYPPGIRPVLATESYDPREGARVLRCWLERNAPFKEFAAECRRGDIIVWGDSHAGRLYTGLHASLEVGQFARDACAPIVRSWRTNACSASNSAVLAEILRLKPKRVILFAAWLSYFAEPETKPYIAGSLRDTLRALRTEISDIVVLGPAPSWTPDLPAKVYDFWVQHGSLPDRLPSAPGEYATADAVLRDVATGEGTRFISLYATLCDQSGCLTHTSNSRSELLTWDYGHLTTAGATFVADLLGLDKTCPQPCRANRGQ